MSKRQTRQVMETRKKQQSFLWPCQGQARGNDGAGVSPWPGFPWGGCKSGCPKAPLSEVSSLPAWDTHGWWHCCNVVSCSQSLSVACTSLASWQGRQPLLVPCGELLQSCRGQRPAGGHWFRVHPGWYHTHVSFPAAGLDPLGMWGQFPASPCRLHPLNRDKGRGEAKSIWWLHSQGMRLPPSVSQHSVSVLNES